MPEIQVNFEVWCTCGNGLCQSTTISERHGIASLTIEPCKRCTDEAEVKGYGEGYDVGYKDAEKEASHDH